MKQLITIILFFQILIGGILPIHDKDETKGIPDLVHHYYTHLYESEGTLTVLDFLKLHYKAGTSHEEQEHESLPSFHWHEIHYIVDIHFPLPKVLPPQVITWQFLPHFDWINLYSFSPQHIVLDPPNTLFMAV